MLNPLLALRQALVNSFSLEEFEILCFDLDVPFDDLPGKTHTRKAQELIDYLDRRQLIPVLLKQLQRVRPHIDWDQYKSAAGTEYQNWPAESLLPATLQVGVVGKKGVGKTATIEAIQDTVLALNSRKYRLRFSEFIATTIQVPVLELQEMSALLNLAIFLIDEEPRKDELERFDRFVLSAPHTPRIVYVNKWDKFQLTAPLSDLLRIQEVIWQKMNRYIQARRDIVYGSARIYDAHLDRWSDQIIPELLERIVAVCTKEQRQG